MTAVKNTILEDYGLDKLNNHQKLEVIAALQDTITDGYPNEEWPQWLCDLIDERLAEPYDPNDCMTLEQFRARLHAQRTT